MSAHLEEGAVIDRTYTKDPWVGRKGAFPP